MVWLLIFPEVFNRGQYRHLDVVHGEAWATFGLGPGCLSFAGYSSFSLTSISLRFLLRRCPKMSGVWVSGFVSLALFRNSQFFV